jgi:hypothetical protein
VKRKVKENRHNKKEEKKKKRNNKNERKKRRIRRRKGKPRQTTDYQNRQLPTYTNPNPNPSIPPSHQPTNPDRGRPPTKERVTKFKERKINHTCPENKKFIFSNPNPDQSHIHIRRSRHISPKNQKEKPIAGSGIEPDAGVEPATLRWVIPFYC